MIIFIRHGQRKGQIYRERYGDPFKKDTSLMTPKRREKYIKKYNKKNFNDKLTRKGIKDTKVLAKILKKYNIKAIYASPYVRCIQTAKIIAREIPVEIHIDKRLQERESYNNIKHIEKDEYQKIWDNYLNYNFETDKLETVKQFTQRVESSLIDINSRHKNENVLIVAHSCLSYIISSVCEGVPADGIIKHESMGNNEIREIELLF